MDQKPTTKTKYERRAVLQHWLQKPTLEDGSKSKFPPTFLVGLRDRLWILLSFVQFSPHDLITDVLSAIEGGRASHLAGDSFEIAASVPRSSVSFSAQSSAVFGETRSFPCSLFRH